MIIIIKRQRRCRSTGSIIIFPPMVFRRIINLKINTAKARFYTSLDRERFSLELPPSSHRLCRSVDSSFFFTPFRDGFNDSGWLMRVIHHLKECHQLHREFVPPSSRPVPSYKGWLTSHANISRVSYTTPPPPLYRLAANIRRERIHQISRRPIAAAACSYTRII